MFVFHIGLHSALTFRREHIFVRWDIDHKHSTHLTQCVINYKSKISLLVHLRYYLKPRVEKAFVFASERSPEYQNAFAAYLFFVRC